MGFFTNEFMIARRTEVLDAIAKLQYEYDDTWNDATISGTAIEENSVVVRASVPPTAEVGTITGIRLLDGDDEIIGSQEADIPTSTNRGKLIVFRCPIQEV